MDQQGFLAVSYFDVGFWDAGLEIENGVAENERLVKGGV